MKISFFIIFILYGISLSSCTIRNHKASDTSAADTTAIGERSYISPKSYPDYKLIWNDEFDENNLNTKNWNYETGTGHNGWGNNELEYYTSRSDNIYLSSGYLVIEARKENYKGSSYTSAKITTQGKKEFTYGRIDIRARLPKGQGIWPALWMLGSNISSVGWPRCGEIDIMEVIGNDPATVHGTLHWKKNNGSHASLTNSLTLDSGDFSEQFHIFSLIWEKDSIKVLVDNQAYSKASRKELSDDGIYPFDEPFYLIFNVAVGGNWPGAPDSTTVFPQKMLVDYVRVFQ